MKERFAKLVSAKTIVTLCLTGAFVHQVVTGNVAAEQFLTVFNMVVAFYFGTQHEKNTNKLEG